MSSVKSDSWQSQNNTFGRIHSPDNNLHHSSASLPLGRSLGAHKISPPQLDSGFVSDLNIPQSKHDFDVGPPSNLLGNSVQNSGYLSSNAISINQQQNSLNSVGIPIGTSAPASGNFHSLGTTPPSNIFGQYDKWYDHERSILDSKSQVFLIVGQTILADSR
jgi:hypothetical protein